MSLDQLRSEVDAIDRELLALFLRRMALAKDIAAHKKAAGLPIYHPSRERAVLARVRRDAGALAPEAEALYQAIFKISRDYQIALPEERR